MNRASIVVDLRHIRCGNCKVTLDDELASSCPTCGALFDSIASNHVGLVDQLKRRRSAAGAGLCASLAHGVEYQLPDLIGS